MTDLPTKTDQRPNRRLLFGAVGLIALPAVIAVSLVLAAHEPAHASAHHRADLSAAWATTHFLLALAIVLGLASLFGGLADRFGQPAVIGEIVAGVILGPSLLAHAAPHQAAWLFPATSVTMLKGLSELGVILFMAGVGREFALAANRNRGRDDLLVAGATLLIPLAAGTALATGLGSDYLGPAGSRPAFVLFLGCVLGTTAFPVLARLIADTGLAGTRIGQLSMYCAAAGDGTIWVLLLVVGGFTGATTGRAGTIGAAAAVVALVVLLTQAHRIGLVYRRIPVGGVQTAGPVVAIAAVAAGSALGGIHEIIGAFAAGVVLARLGGQPSLAVERLVTTARTVLFPVFLVLFGMSVDLTAVSWSTKAITLLVVLIVIGSAGKVLGAASAARVTGLSWRDGLTVGALVNARGMTELVVLQTGAQLGVISPTMLVLLTVATLVMTVATAPAVAALKPRRTGDDSPLPDHVRNQAEPQPGRAVTGRAETGPAETGPAETEPQTVTAGS